MSEDNELLFQQPISLEKSSEFNVDAAVMRAQQQERGAMMLAKQFPRNEDNAIQSLMRSCKRSAFAEKAEYAYPRGNVKNPQTGKWEPNIIRGASINLMKEAARCWGNLQSGMEIIRDTEDERHIRCFAWDMETNYKPTAEVIFRKVIQRKIKDGPRKGETEWVRPDERDLRELTNRQASIAIRNCIGQIIPFDVVEDAKVLARETKAQNITADPDAAKKRILSGFDTINVTVAHLEKYLGHKVSECSPKELEELRSVWASISDGNSTWTEHMEAKMELLAEASITAAQAVDYFNAFKASGWTTPQSAAWLKREFNIDDARKMSPEHYDRAMSEFAKVKATKDIPPSKAAAQEETKPETKVEEKEEVAKPEPAKEAKPAAKGKVVEGKTDAPALIALSTNDPTENKILQLFDIIPIPVEERQPMLRMYLGRWDEMLDALESQLPAD
jgi:hypothetical protein